MKPHKILILITVLIVSSCSTQQNFTKQDESKINQLLDNWHHAAAVADENTFFNSFTKDGIYIGTDPTEHWKATELQQLFSAAFQRESAWDFTPHDRHIYYSKDGKTVWFDELLDTWMGPCRGSGVVELENGQWKIAHYHLSVAVPNDKIKPYLKILKVEK